MRRALTAVSILAILTAGGRSVFSADQTRPVVVILETEKGGIEIQVDTERAPVTAGNFLKYVDAGLYDSGEFYRTVRPDTETRTDYPIQVIQARIDRTRVAQRLPPIPIERTSATGLKHLDGVISMARGGPDSARDEFFICIGDLPELDFGGRRNADGQGFAAFGKVAAGMEVVKAIQVAPVRPASQNHQPPVRILKARRK